MTFVTVQTLIFDKTWCLGCVRICMRNSTLFQFWLSPLKPLLINNYSKKLPHFTKLC